MLNVATILASVHSLRIGHIGTRQRPDFIPTTCPDVFQSGSRDPHVERCLRHLPLLGFRPLSGILESGTAAFWRDSYPRSTPPYGGQASVPT